ncbi:S66 family peptidase [Fusibacter bizertensis]
MKNFELKSLEALIHPSGLKSGDKIMTVSLSWGGAGEPGIIERYKLAKSRLEDDFGFIVIESEHALKGSRFLYEHPELRAKDFMNAFLNPEIKGIFSCIGGDDTLRLLPYIDFEIIRSNPKVFLGYSDSTVNHFMCLKAGLGSFYGPAILSEFGENVKMHDFTVASFKRALINKLPIGKLPQSEQWTSERLEWNNTENLKISRTMNAESHGAMCLSGSGTVEGRLIGGCIEVLDWLRGTELWPAASVFDGAILFLETSEDMPSPDNVLHMLRCFSALGIFDRIGGIIMGKPYHEKYFEAYQECLLDVVVHEAGQKSLPIMYNINIGHTAPMLTLPMGVLTQINCENQSITILESGIV